MNKILDVRCALINRRQALGRFSAATLLGCGGEGQLAAAAAAWF